MSHAPTLTTPRLLLRAPADADTAAIHDLHRHKPVADGVLTIPHPHTLDDAAAWLARIRVEQDHRLNLVWMICLHDDVVGDLGLHIDLRHRRGVLGYLVRPDHWGRGIATEAIRAAINYGFATLDPPLIRIEADHYPENPASGRVLEKLGFTREGVLRSYLIKDGVPRDAVRWALLRGEWRG